MDENLNEYAGRFHVMPNVVSDILSGDAYKIFCKIYETGKETMTRKKLYHTVTRLSYLTRMSRKKVSKCLKEIEEVGFMSMRSNRLGYVFSINWDEISAIDDFSKGFGEKRRGKLSRMINSSKDVTPFSQLSKEQLGSVLFEPENFNEALEEEWFRYQQIKMNE